MGFIEIQSGKDLCPRCNHILIYETSDEAMKDIHTCEYCKTKYKYEQSNGSIREVKNNDN